MGKKTLISVLYSNALISSTQPIERVDKLFSKYVQNVYFEKHKNFWTLLIIIGNNLINLTPFPWYNDNIRFEFEFCSVGHFSKRESRLENL